MSTLTNEMRTLSCFDAVGECEGRQVKKYAEQSNKSKKKAVVLQEKQEVDCSSKIFSADRGCRQSIRSW